METEETLPFPPPFTHPCSAERKALATPAEPWSGPSLEQLTEAGLAELRDASFLWETPPPRAEQIVMPARERDEPNVIAARDPERSSLVPLHWRGLPVCEELQVYALRVARGEDVAPYRGPILADPSLELAWDAARVRALRTGTRRGARLLLALAALGAVAAFVLPHRETPYPELTPPAPTLVELPLSAAPAPIEAAPLRSDPLPELREPLGQASAPAAPGATASKAAARTAQHAAQQPAPSGDSAGPSMLLVDEPSF